MRLRHVFVFAAVATLAGCAFGPTPQTPGQFRDAVKKGGVGSLQETYQVNGPYARVAARVKRKAAECLNRTLTLESCVNGACSDMDYIFHERFRGNRHGSELSVQLKFKPDHSIHVGGPPPKDGMFVAVADITPAANGKAEVSMYGMDLGMYKYIPKAVKHWADDSNLGCPDFSAGM